VLGESGDLLEYVGTVIDLTDHVRTEEALRRSREELAHVTRVMSLGALTASIGHDLNQFVVAIVANGTACLHWLAREQPNLDEATAAVRRIMRDAELIGDVVGNVRAFLGKAAQPSTDLDLAAVIREVRELVEPEATRHRVVIEETLAEGLPRARGVRIEVQQVLLNLMTNAIDAMAGITDGPRVVRVRAEPDSRARATAVLVAIEDSGTGFAGVDERRLYDAFYTTKPHGLGMGLSIAHSIVERHGGRLWATPNAVHGVTFQFMLPVEPLP
jgi:C4-dicarboxylate-specific signal transduction histidine kinase